MPDLIDQLRAYAEAAEAAVPEAGPVPQTRRGRGRGLLAAAAAVAIIAAVASVVALQDDDDAQPVLSGADDRTAVPEGGRWDELPPAPIAGRTGHVMVATEDELVVWGGRNDEPLADGAAWSFETKTWRKLAPSPLTPRSDAVAVWTGREVLIFGGSDDSEAGHPYDGAAYDPASDAWRPIGARPFGAVSPDTGAAWTGRELILAGVLVGPAADLVSDTFSYDPEADAWSSLPASPPVDAFVRGRRAIWTDEGLLVVSIADDQLVTLDWLDAGGHDWGPTVTTALEGGRLEPADVVQMGNSVVLASAEVDGAIWDLPDGGLAPIGVSGSRARYPAGAVDGVLTVGDRFLVPDGGWHDAAPIPVPREFPGTAVHDGRFYVWGGDGCGPTASCSGFVDVPEGLVWTPPSTDQLPTTTTTVPEAGLDLDAETACGPGDGPEVAVRVRSDVERTATIELVVFTDSDEEVVVGTSDALSIAAGSPVEVQVALEPDYYVRTGRPRFVTIRVVDESGATLAAGPLELEFPGCG